MVILYVIVLSNIVGVLLELQQEHAAMHWADIMC